MAGVAAAAALASLAAAASWVLAAALLRGAGARGARTAGAAERDGWRWLSGTVRTGAAMVGAGDGLAAGEALAEGCGAGRANSEAASTFTSRRVIISVASGATGRRPSGR